MNKNTVISEYLKNIKIQHSCIINPLSFNGMMSLGFILLLLVMSGCSSGAPAVVDVHEAESSDETKREDNEAVIRAEVKGGDATTCVATAVGTGNVTNDCKKIIYEITNNFYFGKAKEFSRKDDGFVVTCPSLAQEQKLTPNQVDFIPQFLEGIEKAKTSNKEKESIMRNAFEKVKNVDGIIAFTCKDFGQSRLGPQTFQRQISALPKSSATGHFKVSPSVDTEMIKELEALMAQWRITSTKMAGVPPGSFFFNNASSGKLSYYQSELKRILDHNWVLMGLSRNESIMPLEQIVQVLMQKQLISSDRCQPRISWLEQRINALFIKHKVTTWKELEGELSLGFDPSIMATTYTPKGEIKILEEELSGLRSLCTSVSSSEEKIPSKTTKG